VTLRPPAVALVLALGLTQVLVAAPVDHGDGPYADRLCGETGIEASLCAIDRQVLAAQQGQEHRVRATADGATCERRSALWVCAGVRSVLAQRGGTTYGDTFLTPADAGPLDPDLVAHELEHVRQWRLFGPDLAVLYLREGIDPCTNYFEESADLDAGGYTCG
jgi:hypothetical protein